MPCTFHVHGKPLITMRRNSLPIKIAVLFHIYFLMFYLNITLQIILCNPSKSITYYLFHTQHAHDSCFTPPNIHTPNTLSDCHASFSVPTWLTLTGTSLVVPGRAGTGSSTESTTTSGNSTSRHSGLPSSRRIRSPSKTAGWANKLYKEFIFIHSFRSNSWITDVPYFFSRCKLIQKYLKKVLHILPVGCFVSGDCDIVLTEIQTL